MIYSESCISTPYKSQKLCRMFCATAYQGIRMMQSHCHTALEVSVVLSGEGIYQTGDRPYSCRRGDVFLFPSNEIHYVTQIVDGLFLMNIQFEPMFVQPVIFDRKCKHDRTDSRIRIDSRLPRESYEAKTISRMIWEIFKECRNGLSGYELSVKEKLFELFIFFRRRYFAEHQEQSTDMRYADIEKAVDYIIEHIAEPISLAVLAG